MTDPPANSARPAIGWYVHLPFCTTKCGYCDFYSLPTIPSLIDNLVEALLREMRRCDPRRPVETVFIGGGTPTVLPAEALRRILAAVRAHTGAVSEFTVEANPSSTDELKLSLLREHGVNRVSFGAQSFHADELRILERIHDPSHISESVAAARAAGFQNINLDLIYAIPGQTLERWRETLMRAIDLGTDHVSCYALMYEPNTSLTRLRHDGRIIPADEDLEADMFNLTIDELSATGFEHYEISNFARPGMRCRANMIYWENREYLGVGPSAVSYLDRRRTRNVPDVRKYVAAMLSDQDVVVESEHLGPRESAEETAVQMLRLRDGIDLRQFRNQTGFDAESLFAGQIARFSSVGLLEIVSGPGDCVPGRARRLRLTRSGLLLANRVMSELLGGAATLPVAADGGIRLLG